MPSELTTVIYPTDDLKKTKAVFAALLGEPTIDTADYAQFKAGSVTVGIDRRGNELGLTGPLPYWSVVDIDAAVAMLLSTGAKVHQAPHRGGGGAMVATLLSADGTLIGLTQDA